MEKSFKKLLVGYNSFRKKYTSSNSIMESLSTYGQKPQTMVLACCDSRVDPALILQCDPGDLFVARNVANIVPPYEVDETHHGTSAALEFGVCFLKVKHLILLGHSQCGGVNSLFDESSIYIKNDFISKWVSIVKIETEIKDLDSYAKLALKLSYDNCMQFPWIKQRVENQELKIHLWFFDIKECNIYSYSHENQKYLPLNIDSIEN